LYRGSGGLFFQLLQSSEVMLDVPKQDFDARLSHENAGGKHRSSKMAHRDWELLVSHFAVWLNM
jgi:hypothetical protein